MNIEKLEKSTIKFSIEVSAEEFKQGIDKAFDVVVQKIDVKGFRKGHVPRSYYDKTYGVESLFEEAVNQIVPEKYYQAIGENKIIPVGNPKFDVDWASLAQDKGFTLTVVVPVKPEVTLGEYKGLRVKKMDTEVTDAEVDSNIKDLLTKDADLVVKESGNLENGDVAIFDFDGSVDGVHFDGGKAENYELEIGSNQFIPGFEAQMIGMAKEEQKDINVTFPEAYHSKDLAGKDAVFAVKLHDIKVKTAKELNDEFVVGLNREGINTVEELKNDTKKNIQTRKESDEKNRVVDQLVEMATNNSKFELPECMVEDEKKEMLKRVEMQAKQYGMELEMFLSLNGIEKEAFMKDIDAQAAKRLGYELVISQIMANEKIQASEDEIKGKFDELAKMYNQSIDDLKKQIPTDQLAYSIAYEKTIDFLVDNADLQ